MRRERIYYEPRPIDRIMIGILGFLNGINGLYLAGPWYLDVLNDDKRAPLQNLFDSDLAVTLFGVLVFLNGLMLVYAAFAKGATRAYTRIVSFGLLSGFLLRLYSFIGVVIALESWRPPSYLSHFATLVMLGAYWIWVRVCVRTIQ